jgi:DNA-binding LacI/PurR family transcriptional regulator
MNTDGGVVSTSTRPTLESVARQASVSRQTVSNVLNAPDLVSPATFARVRAVIDEVGYRPHRGARALRTRRSHLVAVRMQAPADPVDGAVVDSFLHALTSQAQQLDNRVLLFAADNDAEEMNQYDELLEDHYVDAFVLSGTHTGDERTAWLAARGAAFVTFGRPWGATAHHGWVDVDGAAGTSAATDALIQRGHRRIAFLGWPTGSGVGDDRRAGYRRRCRAAKLSTTGLDCSVTNTLESGRAGAVQLLDAAAPPTAIVCASDALAIGAWSELTARGLRPGADVALIGFDDTPTASVIGLSSVAQPLDQVAAQCLAILQSVLIEDGPRSHPPEPVLLTPNLVLRTSS